AEYPVGCPLLYSPDNSRGRTEIHVGYPVVEAAAIARSVTEERAWALRDIRFVLFSEPVHSAWTRAFG
ncbi:MAG: hypothetical protein WBM48_08360, partial [Polyangiales bacterium]